ncbi:MAG: L-lactate permease [Mycobacterium leprae]
MIFSLSQVGPIKGWLDTHGGWAFRWPGLSVVDAAGHPLSAATYTFTVVSGAGTMLLVSGVLTALLYPIAPGRAARLWVATVVAFRWTIVTVMAVLALAYVMNFSGQTVTLGQFLSKSGQLFALLSPIVGWLGVAVTGSDTSSNALFGLLQKTAAQETGTSAYLLAAANTSGGVLGKMISPQNLAVAAAVVCLEGREGDLFRHVVLWSLGLLAVLCVLVFLQSTPVLGWMVTGP